MAWPIDYDVLATNKTDATPMAGDHPAHHNALASALMAVEQELGLDPSSATYLTVRARLDAIQAAVDSLGGPGAGAILESIVNANGDLIVGTADDTVSRLAMGTFGQYLMAGASAGLLWVTEVSDTGWFNVKKQYGAVGDGVANDHAAIQAAIDACVAQGGGVVYLPFGTYRILSTLVVPPNVTVTLMGAGKHRLWAGTTGIATKILRTGGTHPAITCTGTSSTSRALMDLVDLEVNGDGLGATGNGLVQLAKAADTTWRRVNIVNTTGRGLYHQDLWNCTFQDLNVRGCGSTTNAAFLLWSTGPGPEIADSVWYTNCQWEANNGTEILISGSADPTQQVHFLGGKIERSSGTSSAPLIEVQKAQYLSWTGMRFRTSVGNGPLVLLWVTVNMRARAFANCQFQAGPGWTGNYFIDQQEGDLALSNVDMYGESAPPAQFFLRTGVGVPADGLRLSNFTVSDNSKRHGEARTGTRAIAGGVYRTLTNTATALAPVMDPGISASLGTITVTGSVASDRVTVVHTGTVPIAVTMWGRVTSAGTVTVWARNNGTTQVTAPAGTIRAFVEAVG